MRPRSFWVASSDDPLELVGDEHARAAEERLGGAVELLLQAARRLLADGAHARLELECARLAQAVDLACDGAVEVLDLAPSSSAKATWTGLRSALGSADLLRDAPARAAAGDR